MHWPEPEHRQAFFAFLIPIESNPAYLNSGLSVYSVSLTIVSAELKKYKRHDEIIEALRTLDYVYFIGEL